MIFRYDDTAPEDDSVRLTHLLDDPLYLLTTERRNHASPTTRDAPWIAGCERCRSHLVEMCEGAGFSPRLAYTTDDMVVMQSLVAAGMGVTTIPAWRCAPTGTPRSRPPGSPYRRAGSTPPPTANRPTPRHRRPRRRPHRGGTRLADGLTRPRRCHLSPPADQHRRGGHTNADDPLTCSG